MISTIMPCKTALKYILTWGCRLLEWFRYVSASVECSTKSMKSLFLVLLPNPLTMHWMPNNTELPWCSTAWSSHLKAIRELEWSWCIDHQTTTRNILKTNVAWIYYLDSTSILYCFGLTLFFLKDVLIPICESWYTTWRLPLLLGFPGSYLAKLCFVLFPVQPKIEKHLDVAIIFS